MEKTKEEESAAYRNNLLRLYIRCKCDDLEAYDELVRLAEAPSSSHPTPEDALVARGYLGQLLLRVVSAVIFKDEKRGRVLLSQFSELDSDSVTCSHLQHILGIYYYTCCVGRTDETFKLYRKSADQGNHLSLLALGYYHDIGEGIPKDGSKAFSFYWKGAEMGNPICEYNLGTCYERGLGCEKDVCLAAQWYRMSARHGYTDGVYRIGYFNLVGKGVLKNVPQGLKYILSAVSKGHGLAHCKLARCYDKGEGVSMDKEKAVSLMMKAMKQRVPSAAQFIGDAYERGSGVEVNIVEAMRYYRKAIEINATLAPDDQYIVSHSSDKVISLQGQYKEAVSDLSCC